MLRLTFLFLFVLLANVSSEENIYYYWPVVFNNATPADFYPAPTPTATATITPTLTPTATPTPTPMPPKKAGAAWAFLNPGNVDEGVNINWWHKWYPSTGITAEMEFVPHIKCDEYRGQSLLPIAQQSLPGDYTGVILFLNEPDLADCPMTPYEGYLFYLQVDAAFPEAQLTTPQVSHLDWYTHHYEWLKEFMSYLEPEQRPEILTVHTYFQHQYDKQVDDLTYLAVNEWGYGEIRIWVTEFNTCKTQTPKDLAFFRDMIIWFNNDPRIERYFVFSPHIYAGYGYDFWLPCRLIDDEGNLTPYGQVWLQYAH